jgi:hypothetical protein
MGAACRILRAPNHRSHSTVTKFPQEARLSRAIPFTRSHLEGSGHIPSELRVDQEWHIQTTLLIISSIISNDCGRRGRSVRVRYKNLRFFSSVSVLRK